LTGEAIILDVSKKTIGEGITNVDLDIYSKIVKPDDIVLLYTGTSNHWDQNESIMQNYTCLEPSAAKWIVDHNIKCIGMLVWRNIISKRVYYIGHSCLGI